MKRTSLVITAVLVCAAVLTAVPAGAQLPRDPAERARVIAQIMEMNARQLTIFDRQGQQVATVGTRDLYNQPVFSPDGKSMAVIKPDLDKENNDLWIIDVGAAAAITYSAARPM